jgi:hypothetical protein
MAVDPVDDCTFWYTNEYYSTTSSVGWETRIATFKFPSCTPPTAVVVKSLTARWLERRIVVAWRTANETQVLGFEVYRSTNASSFRKLNRLLVTAAHTGSGRGGSYRFADPTVMRGSAYTYRLRIVTIDGKRSWYGIGATATNWEGVDKRRAAP